MCSYAELRAPRHAYVGMRNVFARALLLAGLVAAVGCSKDHPCVPEVCDGTDNDCDGRVDEGFVDGSGLYTQNTHCGACTIDCAKQLPTAASTRCDVSTGAPMCAVASCHVGEVVSGDSACVPELPVLCLPCSSDDECALRSPGARCLSEPGGAGRCGRACSGGSACPDGYGCVTPSDATSPQCRPNAGSCLCGDGMNGAELACQLDIPGGHSCVGVQRCSGSSLGACEPLLDETCNGQDDDCDQHIDEGFVDSQGRYASDDNCGACGRRCVPPGAHMNAACGAHATGVSCDVACASGYVDVDGLLATGCECKLESGPVIVVGGDANCDGTVDPTPSLVFVSPAGDDSNDGTEVGRPVLTIARGLAQGLVLGRSVLVARGIYDGPIEMLPGVTLLGGYSPDFRAHDPELYPVLVELPGSGDGKPVLVCAGITAPSLVDGFTLVASEASVPGVGSTAVLLDGCGPRVELDHLTVLAARGAPGPAGDDSSARLSTLGYATLADLGGVDGGRGRISGNGSGACSAIAGGAGSTKQCLHDISGGAGGAAECPSLSCDNVGGGRCGNAGCTDYTVNGVCDFTAARLSATPNPAAVLGKGMMPGRAGQLTFSAPTNHSVCTFCDDNPTLQRNGDDGGDGGSGMDGSSGAGCTGSLQIDSDGRASASRGLSGSDGSDGSGGGGGSAGAGYVVIAHTSGTCGSVAGGSGGGGGSGGCGAPGATGGGGGGASFGVFVRMSPGMTSGPTFSALRVVTASGGDGGSGGIGASGGRGGVGGLGGDSQFWCARNGGRGGDGGPGGSAGGGGGGCGGASVGVYIQSLGGDDVESYAASLGASAKISLAGAAGHGGRGGFSKGNSGGDGADGVTNDLLVATP